MAGALSEDREEADKETTEEYDRSADDVVGIREGAAHMPAGFTCSPAGEDEAPLTPSSDCCLLCSRVLAQTGTRYPLSAASDSGPAPVLKQGLAPQETDGPSSLRDSSWADTPRGVAPWKPPIHNILAQIPNAELPQNDRKIQSGCLWCKRMK